MISVCGVEVVLEDSLLNNALVRAESVPILQGSHRKFQANVVGSIGEVVFEKFLVDNGVPFEDDRHKTEHDYRVGSSKFTVDVKTKDRTVIPKPNYDCSVPLYNHEHQRPQYYVFVSLLRNKRKGKNDIHRFTSAFLLGGIDIESLDADGTTWRAGQTDPANGTTFWTACKNVSVSQLINPGRLLTIFLRK